MENFLERGAECSKSPKAKLQNIRSWVHHISTHTATEVSQGWWKVREDACFRSKVPLEAVFSEGIGSREYMLKDVLAVCAVPPSTGSTLVSWIHEVSYDLPELCQERGPSLSLLLQWQNHQGLLMEQNIETHMMVLSESAKAPTGFEDYTDTFAALESPPINGLVWIPSILWSFRFRLDLWGWAISERHRNSWIDMWKDHHW